MLCEMPAQQAVGQALLNKFLARLRVGRGSSRAAKIHP